MKQAWMTGLCKGAVSMAIKTLFFDVNETMMDMTPARNVICAALECDTDEQGPVMSLWFATLLQYAWVETLTDSYRPFAEIGAAALQMLAKGRGVDMGSDRAIDVIGQGFSGLTPHGDVLPALQGLKTAGYRLVALSNSSASALAGQFAASGLDAVFDHVISTDAARRFKPHPLAYEIALELVDCLPEETAMVAAHAWDLEGAKHAGLTTVFVERDGQQTYPAGHVPDVTVTDFSQLGDHFPQLDT